jgi:putative addiction module component (TIGR02574 family)
MVATLTQSTEQALSLTESERAELAHRLLLSLDEGEDEGAEEAWEAEVAKRVEEINTGAAKDGPSTRSFRKSGHGTSEAGTGT